jgi:hypothetical protein
MRMTQAPVLTVSDGETAGDFGADDSSTMALLSNWVFENGILLKSSKSVAVRLFYQNIF